MTHFQSFLQRRQKSFEDKAVFGVGESPITQVNTSEKRGSRPLRPEIEKLDCFSVNKSVAVATSGPPQCGSGKTADWGCRQHEGSWAISKGL